MAVFVLAWLSYPIFAERHAQAVPSLHNTMNQFRRAWMVRMIQRENRMLDVNILRTLARNSQFFASTTILVLGALIALTGYIQQAMDVVSGLPFTTRASARLIEVKIVLLVVVFVYAFFKFTWSLRQYGQCTTLIGAAPPEVEDNPEQHAPVIDRIARLTSYAGANFNNGLRAYYFGLAALAWFLHPWLMIVATAFVIYVLYAREFKSDTLGALRAE